MIKQLIHQKALHSVRFGVYVTVSLVFNFHLNAQPGSPDPSFNGTGKVTTIVSGNTDMVHEIALQSDGKIVAAGTSMVSGANDFALARYNSNGSLDLSFGISGKVKTQFGLSTYDDGANSVVIQADQKIVAVGYGSATGANYDFALARYNSDGSLDVTFDADGKVTTPILAGWDAAVDVAIQTDGKIVVAGYAYNGTNYDFAVARYNTDGSLDVTFDGDGKATTAVGSFDDMGNSVSIQSDGKIVVVGEAKNSTGATADFAVVRYNTNGSLDVTFDVDGKVTTTLTSSNNECRAGAIQADGKIVAAGYAGSPSFSFALVRYNTNGSLDVTFDGDGKLTTLLGVTAYARSVVIQPDGKIVASGWANVVAGGHDFGLARYNTNGSLDATFDTDGKVTLSYASPNKQDEGIGLALQPDGKIVMGGYAESSLGGLYDFGLARFGAAPLPVKLVSFAGKNEGAKNILEWQTASELNNDYFSIERSEDGINFNSIGTVNGAGNSSTVRNYELTDSELSSVSIIYYRLKQTDYDGKYEYFGPVSISHSTNGDMQIFPTLNNGQFTIVGTNIPAELSIYDAKGNLLDKQYINTYKQTVSTSLPGGVYLLQLQSETKTINRKIIITK